MGVVTDQHYKTRACRRCVPASISRPTLVDKKHNSEICVIGQTTLDNGLTVGVNVQIEANSESDNDRRVRTSSCSRRPSVRLIIGDENNAGYLLHVTAPDGGISLDSGDLCNIRAFETGGGSTLFDSPLCTTNLRLRDNNSGKFTYITPRFAGFQAGVSYIPKFEQGGDNNSALTKAGTGDVPDTGGAAPTTVSRRRRRRPQLHQQFGDFGVQASGGVLWAQAFSGGANVNNSNLIAYNAGAQFSFAGFSVGGGWMYVPQGQATATTKAQRHELDGRRRLRVRALQGRPRLHDRRQQPDVDRRQGPPGAGASSAAPTSSDQASVWSAACCTTTSRPKTSWRRTATVSAA